MPLRILFMGTAELARASLRALLASNLFDVVAVVTQPDRPKGRALKPQSSPVKQIAIEAGLSLLQPERARDAGFISNVAELKPELIVVAAYGQLLPQAILDLPRLGCVNVHASLLPKYRGAAPIQWAILNGDQETGVTIMKMSAGLDTGDILTQKATPIGPRGNNGAIARPSGNTRRGFAGQHAFGFRLGRDKAATTGQRKRHPCAEDLQGRWPHGLDPAGGGPAESNPGFHPLARHLRGFDNSWQAPAGKILGCGGRVGPRGAWPDNAGGPQWACHRLWERCVTNPAIAGGRRTQDECRGVCRGSPTGRHGALEMIRSLFISET